MIKYNKMKRWHKILIAGIAVAALAIGARIGYEYYLKRKNEKSAIKIKHRRKEIEKLTYLCMDEVLLRSMEKFEEFSAIIKILKSKNSKELEKSKNLILQKSIFL